MRVEGIVAKLSWFASFGVIDVIENDERHRTVVFSGDKDVTKRLRREIKVGDLVRCDGDLERTSGDGKVDRILVTTPPECIKMRVADDRKIRELREVFLSSERTRTRTGRKRKAKRADAIEDGPSAHRSSVNPRERGRIFSQFVLQKMDRESLNAGSGVVDIAGGSGHVSMAFALSGVKSTCVDPRKTCGMLPRRDRKHYRRALKRIPARSAVVPFDTIRAWFGGRVDGADTSFSGGADDGVPCVGTSADRHGRQGNCVSNCSAVVAMHPDEATEPAIDWAVEKNKPFFIVPCCLFSRLFPERRLSDGSLVENTSDFVRYLRDKHPEARVETLSFEGSNQCVYWAGES